MLRLLHSAFKTKRLINQHHISCLPSIIYAAMPVVAHGMQPTSSYETIEIRSYDVTSTAIKGVKQNAALSAFIR
ncbi:unnamed protein product [Taenia asiatica]|uniref:Secreted protein n=1 Tax=Taenia asiatica TaxID=60517 RepID=A0A0R3VYZ6_TAEAS|nr:unnamed protein product [Taenia asiatica]